MIVPVALTKSVDKNGDFTVSSMSIESLFGVGADEETSSSIPEDLTYLGIFLLSLSFSLSVCICMCINTNPTTNPTTNYYRHSYFSWCLERMSSW